MTTKFDVGTDAFTLLEVTEADAPEVSSGDIPRYPKIVGRTHGRPHFSSHCHLPGNFGGSLEVDWPPCSEKDGFRMRLGGLRDP